MTVQTKQPYQDKTLPSATRVQDLLGRMTLAEKIGQMTQVEKNSIVAEDIHKLGLGSLLSGGGGSPEVNTPASWRQMVVGYLKEAQKTRLKIPLLYGVDAVHGHNNVVGATIFPHNIGLGATRNPELVEQIARATAVELEATGVRWDFAPTVAVPRDIRWGRTYEGFGEETELVAAMGSAYVRGIQGEIGSPTSVLCSVKHFVGDGATLWGTTNTYDWTPGGLWSELGAYPKWSIDQGDCELDEATLRAVHLPPYTAAIEAGALNVMASYNSWHGVKLHDHTYLLTDVLKGELGFRGFVVSDWMAIDQIDRDFYTCVVRSINAGLDMIMVPFDYKRFVKTLTKAVYRGDISQNRIDDAVGRILTVKFELGLFEQPLPQPGTLTAVGCDAHRQLAATAVRQSQVLLKNRNNMLPLPPDVETILVAGDAHDIGLQCGGWTIEWQGARGGITPGSTVLDGIRTLASGDVIFAPKGDVAHGRAAVGIVVLGEEPYAEGQGDNDDLSLSNEEIELVKRVSAVSEQTLLILFAGRPRIVTPVLPFVDAFVAGFLPGSEGAAVADLLFGRVPFTGKLSYSWPGSMEQIPRGHNGRSAEHLFPYGAGIVTG